MIHAWPAEPTEPEVVGAYAPAAVEVPYVAAAGLFAALAIVVGALGPWVHVSLIAFDGVQGVGVAAFCAGGVALVGNAALIWHRRRVLATLGVVAAGVALAAAALSCALVVLFSNSIGAIVAVLGRRGVPESVGSVADVSVGWGLVLTAVGALILGALALVTRAALTEEGSPQGASRSDTYWDLGDPHEAGLDPWN
jgi:hypothetical protein